MVDQYTVYGIPFTQFLRPDGRERPCIYQCERLEVFEKAHMILNTKLFRFETEELKTGQVHSTITSNEMDHAAIVEKNGPEHSEALNNMILNFDIDHEKSVLKQMKSGE